MNINMNIDNFAKWIWLWIWIWSFSVNEYEYEYEYIHEYIHEYEHAKYIGPEKILGNFLESI